MRWTIAASCAFAFVVGVVILAATPGFERLPPGGRAIPYLGITLAWGFIAVGSYAWLRRPDNRTGMLMTVLGLSVCVSGLGLFDVPALWAIGSMADTVTVSLLVHLLLAFPSGRLEGRGARIVVAMAYAAGALQPALVLFSPLRRRELPHQPAPDRRRRRDRGRDRRRPGCVRGRLGRADGRAPAPSLARVEPGAAPWPGARAAARRGDHGARSGDGGDAARRRRARGRRSRSSPRSGCFRRRSCSVFCAPASSARPTVARLIEQLARDPRSVRDGLAAALGDETLVVAYWLPDRGYVDREGHALPPLADGRVLTEIDHEGRRVGALVHAAAVARRRSCSPTRPPPRRWRSRTRGSRSSCGRGWRRCGPRGRGWWRRATPSAGGSGATCTTARSSGSWR